MTNKIIWLIDDDPIYHIIMKKVINKSGLTSDVTSFQNGKDAISSLVNSINENLAFPDLILLDIEMPILDGWGFMSEWLILKQQLPANIQIYISSSSIAIEDKTKAKNNPDILGYMSKPISVEDLLLIANKE
ncbi:MAG: response regulator [Flavobacteriaceae bacterium]|uniref:Response regulator n=1 Tax=Flavobacterium kayseriense TaxID=2764714 RepID=A0ABR7J8H5_9FLAO|nr:response regulator [Flavobacterium kayseriense]MBC5841761.1 response regulator [Flavobacterium kayseriense]MBC5848290.1 response regulator [Flavobacterium kayseriense]MBU0941473.1 response regulator [Bacteroidota bacterium]MBX9889023.1 response regulator [Flavobacteriaceae bacterium]